MSSSAIDAINSMQRRILAGEEPSADEMREVINLLRSERGTAHASTVAKKTPAAPLDIAALFAKKETPQ